MRRSKPTDMLPWEPQRASSSRSPTEMLKAREVADLFGCCLKTLHNWERIGILIPHRINGRRHFRVGDVHRLLFGREISDPDTCS